jgi:3-methyl-2-oxobutanoate hydroxymethyltransferase
MSKQTASNIHKMTVPKFMARKRHLNPENKQPLVCLTAYSKPMAQLIDPHVDMILVGDSLGMVLYGFETTLPVTLDMMIQHGAAVKRGASTALIVIDLPFGTYQMSPEQAYTNAARVMVETGCSAVKIEGGMEMAETVKFLTQRGIPVLCHIGLMPQSLESAGGYRAHGREAIEAAKLLNEAKALEDAGAFAIVLEGIVEAVAAKITAEISIPTIGIGASPACDGQILVSDDVLGIFQDFTPKFVKQYAQMGAEISKAIENYASDVRDNKFPESQHCFGIKKAI